MQPGEGIRLPEIDISGVEIERTEEFLAVAKRLSDFISSLPISNSANDKLIEFVIRQVQQAEKDSFMQGFSLGLNIGLDISFDKNSKMEVKQ